jgi:hypothetical protein
LLVKYALITEAHNVYMKGLLLFTLILFVALVVIDGVVNEGHYRQTAWQNTKYEGQKVSKGMSSAAESLFR